ncbi:MAG: hypothetical protein AAFZ49_15735, partial [Cyanobacteria bacterium J06659_2]
MAQSQSIFSPFARKLVILLWLSLSGWLIYGMFVQQYPAAYLVEWQLQLFDGYYYPKFTILMLVVGAMIVAFAVGLILDFVT